MRGTDHRCIRWRRIRIAYCSSRPGRGTDLNFISNFPPTTRPVMTDSSRCSGMPGCACTRSVTDPFSTSVPSACGIAATGSNLSGLSGEVIGASLPSDPSEVTANKSPNLPGARA